MPISYEIVEAQQLLIETVTGEVSFEAASTYLRQRAADPRYAATRKGILDLRNASMEVSRDALERYRAFYRSIDDQIIPRRWAILADSPREVAFVMIVREVWSELGMESAVFATEAAARTYLGLS